MFRKLVDVCNTVAYAHSRGVLHRDLKPGNIMIGPFGETLVMDWGVAKLIGRSDGRGQRSMSSRRPTPASRRFGRNARDGSVTTDRPSRGDAGLYEPRTGRR